MLTRLAQADSFSWDNIAPPQADAASKPHNFAVPQADAAIDTHGWPEFERRKVMFAAALAKIPKPPAEKCRWGPFAGGSNDYAHLSLAIVEPRQHEWMRAVLWNACHIWGGSGAVCSLHPHPWVLRSVRRPAR